MLYFIREVKPDIPVIYFRGFPHPTKHRFADRVIQEWNLNIIEPLPVFRDVISNNAIAQIVEVYRMGIDVHFPLEAPNGYEPDRRSFCAIDKLLAPTAEQDLGFDTVFIGHRGDDIDPFWGEIGADRDMVEVNGVRFAYPLLQWSEKDIWDTSEKLGIPQNTERYSGVMDANNDYYPICTSCVSKDADKVWCPKTGQHIRSIAAQVQPAVQAEIWSSRFINLRTSLCQT